MCERTSERLTSAGKCTRFETLENSAVGVVVEESMAAEEGEVVAEKEQEEGKAQEGETAVVTVVVVEE